MTADIAQLETNLRELTGERDALVAARTNEATAEAARAFLDAARARSEGLGSIVVGGHAVGDPLDDVLRAFLVTDPRLEPWLVEQAGQFAELTEKERASRLKKIDTAIASAQKDLLAARKAAAMAQLEADFAAAGEAA